MGIRLELFHDSLAYSPRPALLMLSGAVGLLFLIVCVNIANLQIGRAHGPRPRAGNPASARRGTPAAGAPAADRSLILSAIGGALGFGIAILARAAVSSSPRR